MNKKDCEAMDHDGDTQTQAGAVFSLTCIENCKHGRSPDPKGVEMIRCCICATWYHNECVGLPDDEAAGVWPCMSCRLMPSQVRMMQEQISTLVSINESLTQQVNQIATLLESQAKKCDEDSEDEESEDEEDDEDDPEPSGSLLIGDSLLRNVKSTCDDLSVESQGGARFNNLKKSLRNINPKKKRLIDIYIVCGTNDTASKKPAEGIANDCNSVIDLAKERAVNVHLSSILPRQDSKGDQGKIDAVNQLLARNARDKGIDFIANDKNFLFRDDSIDESLLNPADGLHLSAKGVSKLLGNLGLQDKATADFGYKSPTPSSSLTTNWDKPLSPPPSPPPLRQKDVQKNDDFPSADRKGPKQVVRFRGASNPLSNLFLTPINIWGMTFQSVEHSYQYRKAIEMNQHVSAEEIRNCRSSYDAMDRAKEVNTDDRWLNMKKSVMYQLLNVKANQCEIFKRQLQSTRGSLLVEDTQHDYWGQGKSGDGLNMMGRLLMTVRDCGDHQDHVQPQNTFPFRPYSRNWHNPRNSSSSYRHQRNSPNTRLQMSHKVKTSATCWYCGEQNHVHQSCRHGKPIKCHKCGNDGHKSKFCCH